MSKEQTPSEMMAEIDDDALKALAPEVAPIPVEQTKAAPQEAEKPKGAKRQKESESERKDGLVMLAYNGKNPSFTLGRYRFTKGGEGFNVERELAAYALTLSCFKEV